VLIHLQIDNWTGMSLGASHYYGKLYYPEWYDNGGPIEVYCTLTRDQAADLNRIDRADVWEAGDTTIRWKTRTALIAAALKICDERWPGAIVLEGSSSQLGPQKVIRAPNAISSKLSELYKRADELGYYNRRRNWAEMDDISEQWDKLLERVAIEGNDEPTWR